MYAARLMTYATWYSVCDALRSTSMRATVVVGMPLNTVTSSGSSPRQWWIVMPSIGRWRRGTRTCGSPIGQREHSNSITEER